MRLFTFALIVLSQLFLYQANSWAQSDSADSPSEDRAGISPFDRHAVIWNLFDQAEASYRLQQLPPELSQEAELVEALRVRLVLGVGSSQFLPLALQDQDGVRISSEKIQAIGRVFTRTDGGYRFVPRDLPAEQKSDIFSFVQKIAMDRARGVLAIEDFENFAQRQPTLYRQLASWANVGGPVSSDSVYRPGQFLVAGQLIMVGGISKSFLELVKRTQRGTRVMNYDVLVLGAGPCDKDLATDKTKL